MNPKKWAAVRVFLIGIAVYLAAACVTLAVLSLQSCITPEPYPVKDTGGHRAH